MENRTCLECKWCDLGVFDYFCLRYKTGLEDLSEAYINQAETCEEYDYDQD